MDDHVGDATWSPSVCLARMVFVFRLGCAQVCCSVVHAVRNCTPASDPLADSGSCSGPLDGVTLTHRSSGPMSRVIGRSSGIFLGHINSGRCMITLPGAPSNTCSPCAPDRYLRHKSCRDEPRQSHGLHAEDRSFESHFPSLAAFTMFYSTGREKEALLWCPDDRFARGDGRFPDPPIQRSAYKRPVLPPGTLDWSLHRTVRRFNRWLRVSDHRHDRDWAGQTRVSRSSSSRCSIAQSLHLDTVAIQITDGGTGVATSRTDLAEVRNELDRTPTGLIQHRGSTADLHTLLAELCARKLPLEHPVRFVATPLVLG
ncbi:hypothetical protein OBBRIDRAFT_631626 [Obba rivulosa]|uniref:Uncharacterized protein n=1 Tax=Obba rivulosa TaxID=1052685 RepID=A0A8E2DJ44_9APHY|nr:hypothetical protein OBBRIDRAFT_631626 [Obba rivulosa]